MSPNYVWNRSDLYEADRTGSMESWLFTSLALWRLARISEKGVEVVAQRNCQG